MQKTSSPNLGDMGEFGRIMFQIMSFTTATKKPVSETGKDPDEISGLVAWHDFSDSSTITLVGSDISQADDKSPSGTPDISSPSGQRPAQLSSEQNSLDVAQFDGVDEYLGYNGNVLSADNSYTKVLVLRPQDLGTLNVPTTDGEAAVFVNTDGTVSIWHTAAQVTSTGTLSTGLWYVVCVTYDSATSDAYIYIDNVEDGSNLNTATWRYNFVKYRVGGDLFGNFGDVDIAENIYYDNVISSTDRTDLYNHLKTKWGL